MGPEKDSEHRDTYIVRSFNPDKGQVADGLRIGLTETARLPGGQRIHSLDRSAFNRAIKAAMKDENVRSK